ncbi:exported protein of unknown function [Nitrosotalea devaniterrae]|uniref:Uncharacterized protein n=1 Tax=Nitrosotalea devaniterrae TaxID=1078905 RepID=A0A128A0L0_9ARCH|nr:exported protein of unknown function [Candidatus Nitrosotalea devanaterra]
MVLVSICALSSANSYADSIASTLESKKIYVFVQVLVRNSDDQLIAYQETSKITIFDLAKLNQLLDQSSGKIDKSIITLDGKKYDLIKGTSVISPSSSTVVSKNIIANNLEGSSQILVEADHDGYPIIPGDKVTAIWTIIRPAS